ncbi:hypothetical protein FACS189451_03900 [Bacteroidia bacterium]|nr:hypothetical protein FACS189446_1700 [Bacteroidia bacterium]GHT61576.1 hypothetical protein FACS189451_03900 [Bacteroidia bacterium]
MEIFLAKELPYDKLEKVGISKKRFFDFPVPVLDRLLTGRLSPLLQLEMQAGEEAFYFRAKIAFARINNEVELKIYRVKDGIDDTIIPLKENEKEALLQGRIVKKSIKTDDKKQLTYLQLDQQTKTLISTAAGNIYIPSQIDNITLTKEQHEKIKSGMPLEIATETKTFTIGIDLTSISGVRFAAGDLKNWNLEKLIEWDRINPGVTGYWKTSENGWEYQEQLEQEKTNQFKR